MGKKRNMFKRNSGFLASCLIIGGLSFFLADSVMTERFPALNAWVSRFQKQEETQRIDETEEKMTQTETAEAVVYETNSFTVLADGSILEETESKPEIRKAEETESVPETREAEGAESDPETRKAEGRESDPETGKAEASEKIPETDPSEKTETEGESLSSEEKDESTKGGISEQTDEILESGTAEETEKITESWETQETENQETENQGTQDAYADMIFPDVCSRYIEESELYDFDDWALRMIRYEIMAVNGRIFESPELDEYFREKSWYTPLYSAEEFDENMYSYLNDYEEANMELIRRYEEEAGYY